MDQFPLAQTRNFGFLTRLAIALVGADRQILAACPERDLGSIRTMAGLMLLVWGGQTALFSIALHTMLAPPGVFRPAFVVGAMLVATTILLLDSFMIMRASWHIHGVQELARGGLILPGSLLARCKNVIFVTVRLGVSLVLAQLSALFLGLLLFDKDITAEIDRTYQQKNAVLFVQARTSVETEVGRLEKAMQQSGDRLAVLDATVAALRRVAIDPDVRTSQLQAAIELVRRRQDAKAAADKALADAETFSINELAGIKASEENSGIEGVGPVRRAAEEKVERAKARFDMAVHDLDAAEAQLKTVQDAMRTAAQQKRDQAQKRLAEVEAERQTEHANRERLEAQRQTLLAGREAAVKAIVERDATRVARDDGFLAHFNGLQRLASDRGTLAVIILIDATAFCIELAAVLSKVFSFVPTTYATLLAKETYREAISAANELSDEIEANARKRQLQTIAPVVDEQKNDDETPVVATPWQNAAPEPSPQPASPRESEPAPNEEPLASEIPPEPTVAGVPPADELVTGPIFANAPAVAPATKRRGRPPKNKDVAA